MKRTLVYVMQSRGMTLPELMVGMAVGLFVATIAISTFVSTRTLNVVNSSSTRMTENARLATETLHTDLRAAGFAGCRTLKQRLELAPSVALNGGIDSGFITLGNSGVRGFTGTGAGHDPALPDALEAASAAFPPLPNSDVISVRVPADNVAMGVIKRMASPTASPELAAAAPGNTIKQGDVLAMSDCISVALFQVTAANPSATGVLDHATGVLIPGNSVAQLYDDKKRPAFGKDATVYRMQTRHYYVAASQSRPGTNSLWRLSVPAPDGGALVPEEVAGGIDQLRVSFGIDTNVLDPEMNVGRYVKASDLGDLVAEWDKVLSARVQFVAATAEDRMAHKAQTYQFAGSAVTAGDRRLRTVLTEVVALRNGAP